MAYAHLVSRFIALYRDLLMDTNIYFREVRDITFTPVQSQSESHISHHSINQSSLLWYLAASSWFSSLRNFPMCVSAIDWKRVLLQKPANTGSKFCYYKGNFSIILMGLADADYRFLYISVGTNGHASDAWVWSRCSLASRLENNTVQSPQVLPGSRIQSPYVLVGDAFPLKTYMMKPYLGLDFPEDQSYCLS